ncbi:MAG: YidC/Oxa1 family membrane protein insertase [Clostridia bacterium]|jgi:YidC/Oxa1 family membrane protein insertase|nr:YidC/Oxa1 family membrane protein insertase [Clostridia bacterium]
MSFFANIFGYILNFFYELIGNYGIAIILFSIILKIVMLPISIKQQKTMKKSAKLQQQIKELQDKYKNNPEKLNKETMDLYKRENMNPFSGCLSGIVQIVILFAVFYLVKSPLTYMKKVDVGLIEQYTNEIKQESNNNAYPEISIIKEKGKIDEKVYINMDFLGIDLSSVPTQNLSDWRVYIIPGLYVITSFLSMRMTANMQNKKNNAGETNEIDAVTQANKSMSYIMPVMSISIAIIAPLGLALYWLISNISIILERLFLDKFLKEEEN